MKKLFVISFLCICSIASFGQFKDFDLSEQILADYKFQSLQLGFNSYGDSQRSYFKNQNQKSTFNNYYIVPSLSTSYFAIRNSRASQFRMSNHISFDGRFAKNSQTESTNRLMSFRTSHSASKLFYNRKNWFIGVAGGISYGAGTNKEKSNGNSFESSSDNIRFSANPSFGIGRIENVTDAWRAYRMLEDLEKWGLLNREPSLEELRSLTELHTARQQIRFFDRRYKLIEDIQILANHLLDSGLANDGNGVLFTSLFDRWLYGANATRTSGRRWQLSFPLNANRRSIKANTTDFEELTGSFEIRLDYLSAKPLNLKWQFDWHASVTGTYFDNDLKEESDDLYSLRPEARVSFGYYPNTRTSITFGSTLQYFIEDWEQFEYLGDNIERAIFGLNTRMNYYFSPQTRLEGSFGFSDNFSPKYYRCQSDLRSLSFYPGTNLENAHCMGIFYRLRFMHSFF